MLDDINVIKQRDPQDALGFINQQPEQLAYDFGNTQATFGDTPIHNVVFAGMGGSSLVAEMARTWPVLDIPYVIWKDYGLPKFVNENTLVICSSYSGNTEEALSSLEAAQQKNAQIAVISGGGKLLDIATQQGYLLAKIPHCPQPRTAIFYMYRALVGIFVVAKLVPEEFLDELSLLVEPLKKATQAWAPNVPQENNPAKRMAGDIVGKTPIIYAGPLMYPVAYKWKINTNENAKNTAWCNVLPEFNHNEFMGWTSHPIEKPFAVIDLISSFENPRILKRFEVSDRLLSGVRPKAIRVEAQGASLLEHMLFLTLFGDFVTTYMAILNGVNPTPVELVEKLKTELE